MPLDKLFINTNYLFDKKEGTRFKDLNSNEHWRGFRGSVPAYICLLGK